MIMGKTSALIAYPCALGALIAGASPQDVEAMFNFGNNLGIAFQMQDDYLDVYGDPATFGKTSAATSSTIRRPGSASWPTTAAPPSSPRPRP